MANTGLGQEDIPDFSMMLPPRMKKGMAMRTDLVMAAETSWGTVPRTTSRDLPEPRAIMAATLDMPRQVAMGAPSNSSRAKRPKSTAVTIA